MKANEMRIGNWYNLSQVGEDDTYQMTGKDIYDFEQDPIDDLYYPIPLTEDWLLKFGFRNQDNTGMYFVAFQGRWHYVERTDEHWKYYQFKRLNQYPLLHVHQLQNLYFALTGEELTINK